MSKRERAKAMMKKNNRGVTLIELLVAVAILTVVIGAGMSFIIHATNAFNRGSGESNLQNEAQLTMARIQNLIVNATHGVSVAPPQAAPAGSPDPVDPEAPVPSESGSPTGVNLYVYNREETDEMNGSYKMIRYTITHIYQSGEQLLYAVQAYAPQPSGAFALMPEGTPSVLSDYITDFQVNLDEFASKRSVKITLGFKNQKQTFTTTNTFLLRNAISDKTDGEADDYFKDDALADQKNEVTALVIDPTDVYMWQGSALSAPFSAKAQVGDQLKPGVSVIWSIKDRSGGTPDDVTISRSTGSIQVGANVTGNLSVHATALSSIHANGSNEAGYVVSNEAIVHVKSFEDVSMSTPMPLSTDDHKTYLATFSVLGQNLEKDSDMGSMPMVMAGSTVSASFEKQMESSGPSSLRWKVIIRRPASYSVDQTYSLIVGYKLNGQTKTCQVSGIRFTPSAAEAEEGEAEVRLWDASTNTAYIQQNGVYRVNASRGSSRELQLQVRYGGTIWQVKDSSDWSITTDNPNVRIVPDGLGYRVQLDVKNYTGTEDININTYYTDNSGVRTNGPKLQYRCSPVKINLAGVNSEHQRSFPVARGATETLSFEIENLEGARVCLLDSSDESSSSTMRVAVNSKTVSIAVNKTQSGSRTYCFGVRTADGEQLPDTVCYEATFVPDNKNVSQDSSGNWMNVFLPRAADLTNYSSQIPVPGEGETARLYTASGKMVIYSMEGGKYYIEYNGKKYVYDSSWRGWMPV